MESQCEIRSTNLWRMWERPEEEKEENMNIGWKIGSGIHTLAQVSSDKDGTLHITLSGHVGREEFESFVEMALELFDIAEEEAEE